MESNTLFVFHNPGAEPDDGFADRLGEYGTAVRILPSVWQVRSDKTGLQLFDALRRRIAGNDQLLVIDTTELGAADDGELLCFVVLAPGATLADVEPRLRQALRTELSPRHVPDRVLAVDAIPHTLNGKKCEVPVKRILSGVDPERAVSRDALANPDSLDPFIRMARH